MSDDEEKRKVATAAFKIGDVEASILAHQHSNNALHSRTGPYIGDFVFGATDGIITTFAVVSGVVGAGLNIEIILILGIASLLADGLSMAVGNFLGERAEMKFNDDERKREYWEIEHLPEEEKKEIREILESKGVTGDDLTEMTDMVCKYPDLWVDLMMAEELQITDKDSNPALHGLVTFVAFVSIGFIPLIGHILGYFYEGIKDNSFIMSIILTLFALIFVGILRVKVTHEKMLLSICEVTVLGGTAAAISYFVGWWIKSLIS